MYQIYDSMDRPCGDEAPREGDLIAELRQLQEESEENGYGLSYAIGKNLPDGGKTFDF